MRNKTEAMCDHDVVMGMDIIVCMGGVMVSDAGVMLSDAGAVCAVSS